MNQPLTPSERRRALEFVAYRQKYHHIAYFVPYVKQRAFLDMGATCRERLFMAGNRCLSYRTPIDHPDGTSTPVGFLYERGKPFQVLSWDGKKLVSAMAGPPIRKPAEPVVRVWTEDGSWFESALNHRVLTRDSGWLYVGRLLESVPCLSASNLAIDRTVRAEGVRHWFGKASDWIVHCFVGFHQRGEPLHVSQVGGPVSATLQGDVRQCSQLSSHSGGQPSRRTNIDHARFGLPSTLGGQLRCAVRSAAFLSRDACRIAQCRIEKRGAARRLSTAAALLLRSVSAMLRGRYGSVALESPSMSGNRIVAYTPIASQEIYDFTVPVFHNYFAAGVIHHNCGKTETGAYEAALHATGIYPSDWKGKRFDHATIGWVCGQTSLAVRDICQAKLLGSPGVVAAQGTGMLPKDTIVDTSLARGVTDAIDTIQVRHVSGGISIIRFKSYEQGRQKFQGEGLDWIWFDEEPDLDIYSEGLTRIGERNGISWLTFTPLLGRSSVVLRFMDEPSADRNIVSMTLDDIPPDGHISPQQKLKIIEGYLPHEREARARGIPILGSGRIFTTPEAAIVEAPIEHIPAYWKKLWGIDIGIGHPFAAVLVLWDVDNDVIHVHHTIRMSDAIPMVHASAMRKIAAAVPVAYPKDAGDRDRGTGEPVSKLYKQQGLILLPEHATWPDGSVSTEAGILEWHEREQTGRLKVAAHLSDWLEERRFYHRKDGQIVKIKDDLMSATRICLMQKRFARAVGLGETRQRSSAASVARNVDFDVFDGGSDDVFAP